MQIKNRFYVRVTPFALGTELMALERDHEHVKDVAVSMEDDDRFVAFLDALARDIEPSTEVLV